MGVFIPWDAVSVSWGIEEVGELGLRFAAKLKEAAHLVFTGCRINCLLYAEPLFSLNILRTKSQSSDILTLANEIM